MQEPNPYLLRNVHREQNYHKYSQYWIGFLEGILASKTVEDLEPDPLIAVSKSFLDSFEDFDATDLLQDIEIWGNASDELFEIIRSIVEVRKKEISINSDFMSLNLFYGFLKGVACDNKIYKEEVLQILKCIKNNPSLISDDPRVLEVKKVSEIALSDNIITPAESDEICHYISKIVGDSYRDTGIGLPNDLPQLDGVLYNIEDIEFEDKWFVLTGQFAVPKSIIEKGIVRRKGLSAANISGKVDYLVLANAGSEHYVTANAGTKILKAINLREKYGRPDFIMESTIVKIL